MFKSQLNRPKNRAKTISKKLETVKPYKGNKKQERGRFISSLVFPLAFVILLWIIKIISVLSGKEFYQLGIYPLEISGLKGILLSPFIHGSFSHLFSNSIPLLVLGTALYYFYREVAFRVFILGLLITGLWVWLFARPSYHIGASGVLYSLAAFLFVSGIIRKHPRLMALSMLVAFLYGGMVWGIFPVREQISWESHLMGMISGALLALFFREHGPQRPLYSWEIEPGEDEGPDGASLEETDLEASSRSDTGNGSGYIYISREE